MALRSLSRVSTPTSGPGRGPDSDSRVRHRRPPERGRARHRSPVPAEELRRRAERLFGDAEVESGSGPPVRAGAPSEAPLADTGRRERAGLALRDRVPLWVQARCGVERRSVLALAVLLLLAAALAAQHFWTGRTQNVSAPQVVREAPVRVKAREAGDGSGSAATPGPPGAQIVVDVGGKVRDPGIRRLPSGSRVADALKAAGGVRPGVRAEGLNRARFLVDGEQIVVGVSGVPVPAGPGVAGSGAAVPAGGGPAAPVSLGTATVEQLDTLPGVGPVLAQRIIEYRTRHGGFRSVDELRQVDGIGDRRFSDLRARVGP
ncbi:ComEA family DNA-binding protein [Streptomyces sp. NPDC027717]|uniref:ComEA family DNA-binding protein n=1 Tax=Streptomyces sp. NPDC027717 TaxID=3155765 RepID=UPI0034103D6C